MVACVVSQSPVPIEARDNRTLASFAASRRTANYGVYGYAIKARLGQAEIQTGTARWHAMTPSLPRPVLFQGNKVADASSKSSKVNALSVITKSVTPHAMDILSLLSPAHRKKPLPWHSVAAFRMRRESKKKPRRSGAEDKPETKTC